MKTIAAVLFGVFAMVVTEGLIQDPVAKPWIDQQLQKARVEAGQCKVPAEGGRPEMSEEGIK